ncbi:MAG: cytochrome b/b6 domain-containing protein [Drouetiella hepatica Uher 2000/2452]|uniref:Cytochrome b/b6 domain-containing protein n=1 Tax=Drouetiella hepatica Uher 2000/2452 TaxID=904376 RepID=A0A951QGD4_9CYAN|nr:cytochrome b/b6 domain-containing protein [Drouetiella hepatica Uher 2000/2452]
MNRTTATEKLKRQNTAFKSLMILHWLMAAFIFLLFLTGVFVAHFSQVGLLARLSPFLHQSFGMLFLMLLIARIFLLLRLLRYKYSRRSPKVTPNWLKATILHSSLYFFMLIAPLSGFFLRNFIGLDTTLLGIPLPSVFVSDDRWVELTRDSHFWSSYIFLVFIFLHVLTYWKVVWINVRRRFIDLRKASSKKES